MAGTDLLVSLTSQPVIGHRGAAGLAPENTLTSFQLALTVGADALEFDVRVTRDGEPVVIHDPALDRTTNLKGPVRSLTLAELHAADAGFNYFDEADGGYPWRGQGIRIPTLREVVQEFPVPLLIEIKEPEAAAAVAQVLRDTGAFERSVIAGADWRSLEPFREAPFCSGASRRDIARLYFGTGEPHDQCRTFAVPDRFYVLSIPTRRFVRAAHARRASVHVWTVDLPRTALALWKKGVNGIVTNRPDVIRAARDSQLS